MLDTFTGINTEADNLASWSRRVAANPHVSIFEKENMKQNFNQKSFCLKISFMDNGGANFGTKYDVIMGQMNIGCYNGV